MYRLVKILFILAFFNVWKCTKFEAGHEKVCLRPFIDYVVTLLDSANSRILIKKVKISNGTIKSAKWNFNDGTPIVTFTKDSFYHNFPTSQKSNEYNIEFDVFNNECTEGSKWFNTIAVPPCLAIPDFDAEINRDRVKFIDKSNLNDQKLIAINWYFDNGNTSASKTPAEQNYSRGIKKVRLSVTTSCGTRDTTKEINIACFADINCPNGDCIQISEGVSWYNRSFSLISYSGLLKVEWDFGDGTPKLSSFGSIKHDYNTGGDKFVTVYLTNECKTSSFTKKITLIKPPEEFKESNLGGLSQSDNYRQIIYIKNQVFVMRNDGKMFKGELDQLNFSSIQSSNYPINSSNKLKNDVFKSSLFNISNFGVSNWDFDKNNWKKVENTRTQVLIPSATDIDCDDIGHYYVNDNISSILYIPVVKQFVQLYPIEKKLFFFNRDNSENTVYQGKIDNQSQGLTLDIIRNRIYFNSSTDIVEINTSGDYIKSYNKSIFLNNETPHKTRIGYDGNIWTLTQNGSLYRINILSNATTKIMYSSINDFDLITNPNYETEVIIAGNGLLKYLKKN